MLSNFEATVFLTLYNHDVNASTEVYAVERVTYRQRVIWLLLNFKSMVKKQSMIYA